MQVPALSVTENIEDRPTSDTPAHTEKPAGGFQAELDENLSYTLPSSELLVRGAPHKTRSAVNDQGAGTASGVRRINVDAQNDRLLPWPDGDTLRKSPLGPG